MDPRMEQVLRISLLNVARKGDFPLKNGLYLENLGKYIPLFRQRKWLALGVFQLMEINVATAVFQVTTNWDDSLQVVEGDVKIWIYKIHTQDAGSSPG